MYKRACIGGLSHSCLLVVGRGVGLGSRSRRWADGSRSSAVRQTEPEGCRERTPHCLHRRPLLLHDRLAAEEPAQVHRSHRGRELMPAHPQLNVNNASSSMWSYSALCWRINPQPVFSATDVLHVPPTEESRRQICQSRACCKLPDELPQVIIAFNNLGMECKLVVTPTASVKPLQLLHRHMIDLSHIDVSLIDG